MRPDLRSRSCVRRELERSVVVSRHGDPTPADEATPLLRLWAACLERRARASVRSVYAGTEAAGAPLAGDTQRSSVSAGGGRRKRT